MATHDYVISNGTGSAVRSDINGALAAIVSQNSNASAPATTYAYMSWADTTAGVMKMRNGANSAWISLYELDGTFLASDISLAAGSAAAPSLFFTGDTNTGLFSPGADTVALATAGSNRLHITSGGLVGIGTTSPVGKLAVGNSSNSFLVSIDSSASYAEIQAYNAPLYINRQGNNTLLNTGGGFVGIGSSAPQAELNVAKTGGAATVYIEGDAGNNATTSILRFGGASGRSASIQGYRGASSNIHSLDFYTYNSADTFGMRLTPTGLGIGTTDASSLFSSGRNVRLSNTSGKVSYEAVVLDGSNNHRVGLFVDNATGDLGLDTGSSTGTYNGLSFYIEGSKKATIDRIGRLLVGTSSDSGGALLQVNGDRVRIATAKTPASASDTGVAGEICWDASYVYVCTATNTWKRTAISTW